MSSTFQNGESIKRALFKELKNKLSPETIVRVLAKQRMKQLKLTEGYGVYLAEFIVNKWLDLSLRKLACNMLTRYVESHWEETQNPKSLVVTKQAKKAICNILPNGLLAKYNKIRSAVAKLILHISIYGFPSIWAELFDIIIVKCLGGNKNSIHAAMQVLSDFTYTEQQIKKFGPIVVSEVYRIFEAEETYSIRTRTSAIQILKPLWESIWQLLTQTADIYVKVEVNESEPNPFHNTNKDGDDELSNFTKMITQIFQFIECIIRNAKFRSIIKNGLTDLVYIMIVYIQVTEKQIETWNDNSNKFVDDENEGEENLNFQLTVRLCGQEVLESLKEQFDVEALPALSEALSRHVSVAECEKSSGNRHWWKIYESLMVALCSFRKSIIDNEDKFDLLNYLTLVRSLMNYESTPYLLGRCLCTLSGFSKTPLYNLQMLGEILDATLNSLSEDKQIVLKICAMRAISEFVTNPHTSSEDRRLLILSKLEGFVDGMIAFFSEYKNTAISLILPALTKITLFDKNFAASVQSKVMQLTLSIFLINHEDIYYLLLVKYMLKALSQNSLCLKSLEEKMIPTLVSILNLQGEQCDTDLQGIALEILTTLVKNSEAPLSETLIESAFPATIHIILSTNNHNLKCSGGKCLRAFIFVSPEQVCTYKNGAGINYIMQVTTILLNSNHNEYTASQIGRIVVTIIIKLGNMLGENIDLVLKAVISKMQLVESLRVMTSLVMTFAHLFITQMEAVLNFLSTTVPGPTGETAMQFVFSIWLTRQKLFYGNYERMVTTMALCKLFEYGVTTQDNRLASITIKDVLTNDDNKDNWSKGRTRSQVAATKQFIDVPLLVKMFKLLINELNGNNENNTENESPTQGMTTDVLFSDDDDDEYENAFFLKDPIFDTTMEEHLKKFLMNFSNNGHFRVFYDQLSDTEKTILQNIQKV